MTTNIRDFDWNEFWKSFPEDIDDIDDVQELIFRSKTGIWRGVMVIPNSFDVLDIPFYYNPFTGEKLS